MKRFIDRTADLDRLQQLYNSESAELAIIYGRRQIGKSRLVLESIKEREGAVYYQAIQETPLGQINRFIDTAESIYPGISDIRPE